ncbi:Lrp/AsnC family transcriptional regulator [Mucilaginibacter sp. KACC 22773]|uniref:Lrp/AsnC family transcriptional regulator n=1 Tax=Mucilaginibacter sp. KACC 22773 TaxID=3025671 RepID=UPI002366FFAE|nr:Lrp/AsnC family transcriptional regulator [Mucilaginibacter sp. KACC 22773]WDF76812.1 Lrp/AsnC family transcriptional regulator [Mucilaginibacter sp. KACC 22773]
MYMLDDYDKKLLRLLQKDNRLTAQALAQMVNLSASAVQRRLAKLRDEKIIEADVAIISPAAAGVGLTCIVDICMQEDGSRTIERFKAEIENCPEVSQCYYVTGTYDLVLIVNTRDMKHYEQFSKKYFMDCPDVQRFYTHVVMDRLKMSYGVYI